MLNKIKNKNKNSGPASLILGADQKDRGLLGRECRWAPLKNPEDLRRLFEDRPKVIRTFKSDNFPNMSEDYQRFRYPRPFSRLMENILFDNRNDHLQLRFRCPRPFNRGVRLIEVFYLFI